MLIPLGILAAGAGGGPTSDYQLISTVFGTGSSSSITFSSIPSTFRHLEIRYVGKLASSAGRLYLRMNGVSSTSYRTHRIRATGSSIGTTDHGSATQIDFQHGFDSSSSNIFAGGVISIFDYSSTSKNTTARGFYGTTDPGQATTANLDSGVFFSTEAVNSLTISVSAAINITSDSRFSLYGIKE
jgi:hypothetical protein